MNWIMITMLHWYLYEMTLMASANEKAALRCQLVFNYGLVFHYGLAWLASSDVWLKYHKLIFVNLM